MQEKLWLSDGSSGFIGSPIEAYEGLFGDSNLLDAMEEGRVELPSVVVDGLARLQEALVSVGWQNIARRELIDHPGMVDVRSIAGQLLREFRSIDTEGRSV